MTIIKHIFVAALCAGVALAACSKEGMSESAAADAVAVTPMEAPVAEAAASGGPTRTAPPAAPVSIPLLAYVHRYKIEAPAKAIDVLVGKHEAACQAAGPAVCQVTEANVLHESEKRVTGTLSLRARADWLAAFRANLANDAEGVGGKIAQSSTGTDDLSVSIVDAEAHIRAKLIMRDRLEDLMAKRTGKISDLMDAERQLAEVRGEIDSAQSNLAVMKNRVRMSQLTIDYAPKGSLASDGAWTPVGDALRNSQDVMAVVVSTLIILLAGLAPLAAFGGLVWFVVRRLKRKVRPAPAV